MNNKLGWILLLSLASVAFLNLQPTQTESEFTKWTQTYSKKYSSKIEYIYREMVFVRNLEKINKHNADPTQTYTMGVNQFADLTQEEFVSRLTLKINATPKVKTDEKVLDLVSDIDWLAAGKVSQTRQGDCGSVWAFPTMSVIESALLVAGKPMELLSIQQIIDCTEDYGNEGCTGYIWPTMDFLVDNGIATEKQYPYINAQGPCKQQKGSYKISDYLTPMGCEDILNGLTQQPILVAVDSSNWAFYKSGIFSNCDSIYLNQAVILVGYTADYWTVMNNWGTTWGEKGMIRLAPGNTCGVCFGSAQPIV